MPEDAIERVFGAFVRLVKRQARGSVSLLAQERIGNLLGRRVHLVERDVGGQRHKRSEIRFGHKTIGHGCGGGIG